MFTVHSCCQPSRLLQSVQRIEPVPGTNTKLTVNGQYQNRQNCPQAIATPSICPCSVVNCSRPNSDQYRRGLRVSSRQPLRGIQRVSHAIGDPAPTCADLGGHCRCSLFAPGGWLLVRTRTLGGDDRHGRLGPSRAIRGRRTE